jgi:hypothetical protein
MQSGLELIDETCTARGGGIFRQGDLGKCLLYFKKEDLMPQSSLSKFWRRVHVLIINWKLGERNNHGLKILTYVYTKTIENIVKQHSQKDKYNDSGICQMKCLDCPLKYIGQTGRAFCTRYREHTLAYIPHPRLQHNRRHENTYKNDRNGQQTLTPARTFKTSTANKPNKTIRQTRAAEGPLNKKTTG